MYIIANYLFIDLVIVMKYINFFIILYYHISYSSWLKLKILNFINSFFFFQFLLYFIILLSINLNISIF